MTSNLCGLLSWLGAAVLLTSCAAGTPSPAGSATPTAQPAPSATSAGPLRDDRLEVSFTSREGLTSRYHAYAADAPQPAGLLLWLHGDGAWEFEHPDDSYVMGGPEGVLAVGRAHGYVVVSALAPDDRGTVTWWENGVANADYLADLLDQLSDQYAIDSSDIVLAGFSGGAQFITQYFLPEYSGLLAGGGSIVFGGGGAPVTPAQQPWNPDLPKSFFMHWATGELDDAEHSGEGYDALGYAKAGEAFYADLGYQTSHEWIEGKDHVIDGLFGGIVDRQLRQHGQR